MLQRKEEILGMNKEHIDMATKLRDKLSVAINAIDPATLKPSDIASLMKLSTELERKARLDTEAQEELRNNLLVDTNNPELKKAQTKQGDISEVLQILLKAGALESVTAIGVRETTTTTREVVAKTDDVLLEEDD